MNTTNKQKKKHLKEVWTLIIIRDNMMQVQLFKRENGEKALQLVVGRFEDRHGWGRILVGYSTSRGIFGLKVTDVELTKSEIIINVGESCKMEYIELTPDEVRNFVGAVRSAAKDRREIAEIIANDPNFGQV